MDSMFNFHKPRVYRSTEGCCICRAKSSSSRFTDSQKYENDSMKCFNLKYPRFGEICNACVLLVKRYKRLPVGSKRHWGHVVDARAGPGTKSLPRHKRIKDEIMDESTGMISISKTGGTVGRPRGSHNNPKSFTEKFSKIFKKSKKIKHSTSPKKDNSSKEGKRKSNQSSNINASPSLRNANPSAEWNASSCSTSSNNNNIGNNNNNNNNNSNNSGCTNKIESDRNANSINVLNNPVLFQTQTRASSYRSRYNIAVNNDNPLQSGRKRSHKLGSKRRKRVLPRKNRRNLDDAEKVQFFDEVEWIEQKACCGVVYECPALAGAIIIDMKYYTPCNEHNKRLKFEAENKVERKGNDLKIIEPPIKIPTTTTTTTDDKLSESNPSSVKYSEKTVLNSTAYSMSNNNHNTINAGITRPMVTSNTNVPKVMSNPTQALKKHHLFFKRQSECFPQGDIHNNNNNNHNNESSAKVCAVTAIPTSTAMVKTDNNNTNKEMMGPNNTTSEQSAITAPVVTNISSLRLANIPATTTITLAAPTAGSSSLSFSSSSSLTSNTPRQSVAKITTIATNPGNATSITSAYINKSHNFLHKVKGDTGKIVKHSIESFNAAAAGTSAASMRLKSHDLSNINNIVKNVEKSYVLSKPTNTNGTTAAIVSQPIIENNIAHTNANVIMLPTTSQIITAPGNFSPSSSSSSTSSSTKFSDNSSDSGFDENMQERKSVSPLQDDAERKAPLRGGVQTMFLASGVQIQGQHQNIVLTGNEVAAKVLQNRKQHILTSSANAMLHNSNNRINITTTNMQQQGTPIPTSSIVTTPQTTIMPSTTVKIAQIISNNQNVHNGNHNSINNNNHNTGINTTSATISTMHHGPSKLRAIYGNTNAIQHENGITTIVPASSYVASSQTAAMQAIPPSSVTITPAPAHIMATTPIHNNVNNNNSNITSNISSITTTTLNNLNVKKITSAATVTAINNSINHKNNNNNNHSIYQSHNSNNIIVGNIATGLSNQQQNHIAGQQQQHQQHQHQHQQQQSSGNIQHNGNHNILSNNNNMNNIGHHGFATTNYTTSSNAVVTSSNSAGLSQKIILLKTTPNQTTINAAGTTTMTTKYSLSNNKINANNMGTVITATGTTIPAAITTLPTTAIKAHHQLYTK